MSSSTITRHEELQNTIAEQYRSLGFDVSIEPGTSAIPFDVGNYAPDLIAKKDCQRLIVEIKAQPEKISFEQLQNVVEAVNRHEGWRFILITPQDAAGSAQLPGESEDQFSWDDIASRIEAANQLVQLGQKDAGYLTLWIAFERMMRYQARRIALPIDRLTPSILIRQLYSQGELSMSQFDTALACLKVRNSIVHGFRAGDFSEATARLGRMVGELVESWPGSSGNRGGGVS